MINPFKFINIPVFLVSLALGIFAVYVTDDQTRHITVFPTPDNLDQLQYKDNAESCFGYQQTQVKCPADASQVYRIPIQ